MKKIDVKKIAKHVERDVGKTIDKAEKDLKKESYKLGKAIKKNADKVEKAVKHTHGYVEKNVNKGVNVAKDKVEDISTSAKIAKMFKQEIKNLESMGKTIASDSAKDAFGSIVAILKDTEASADISEEFLQILNSANDSINALSKKAQESSDGFYVDYVSKACVSASDAIGQVTKIVEEQIAVKAAKESEVHESEDINVPEKYELIKKKPPKEMNLPKGAKLYGIANEGCSATVAIFKIDEKWVPMDLDDIDANIAYLRESMDENQGIIEVNKGNISTGGKYIYNIIKQARGTAENREFGMDYMANFNFQIGEDIYYMNAAFFEDGITGTRDNMGMFMIRQSFEENAKEDGVEFNFDEYFQNEWFRDPYDKTIQEGMLMNESEIPELDEYFPNHPLSELRALIKHIIDNN